MASSDDDARALSIIKTDLSLVKSYEVELLLLLRKCGKRAIWNVN